MQRTSANQRLSSNAQHRSVQRSTTLNRKYVKRPTPKKIMVSADEPVEIKIPGHLASSARSSENLVKSSTEGLLTERPVGASHKGAKISHIALYDEPEIKSVSLEDAIVEAKGLELPKISKFGLSAPAPINVASEKKIEILEEIVEDLPPAPNPYEDVIKVRSGAMEVRKAAGRSAQFYVGPTPEERKNAEIEKALAEVAKTRVVMPEPQISARVKRTVAKAERVKKAQIQSVVNEAKQEAKPARRMMRFARAERPARVAKNIEKRANSAKAAEVSEVARKEESLLEKNVKVEKQMERGVRKGRGKRLAFAFACSAACVVALGVLVYNHIPDISVKVTAMQSGIEASYPSYVPRDFSMSGVYIDDDGAVVMDFEGPEDAKFSITESESSWDSTALLNNFVKKKWSESDYTAMRESGITIYICGSDAVWVNGGILYKIQSEGNTLTKKQIKNIVTSM